MGCRTVGVRVLQGNMETGGSVQSEVFEIVMMKKVAKFDEAPVIMPREREAQ